MRLRTRLVCLLLAVGIVLSSAAWCAGPKNVLVIVNDKSLASRIIGAYYASKRKIPAKNVYHIKCDPAELTPTDTYWNEIQKPVKEYLAKYGP